MDDFMSDEENENVSDIDPEELQKMLAVIKNQNIYNDSLLVKQIFSIGFGFF